MTAVRRPRYHHGDLRAALVDTAIEVISERGIRGFSLAEASRRLGVAVSAPYAHFADREELLVAVAVHAHELFYAAIAPEIGRFQAPADRLTAMARGYVRFAAANRPLFEMLYEAGLDKARHPEIEQAEQPLTDAFMTCVRALSAPARPARPLAATIRPPPAATRWPMTWPPRWRPPRSATSCCSSTAAPARTGRRSSARPTAPPGRPPP